VLTLASVQPVVDARGRQAPDLPPGLYTDAQSKRGENVYGTACASCHGANMAGGATLAGDVPALAGPEFRTAFGGMTAADLLDLMRSSMPLDKPGQLSSQEYTDVLAYILSRNDFPAGPTELSGDPGALKAIHIEKGTVTAGPAPNRSILEGVFAEPQSRRGAAVYAEACSNCHAPTLGGKDVVPALVGPEFLSHWTGSTAGDLFERIRTSMPQDRPGTLSPQQYADVIAYIFDKNRFPAGGKELQGDHDTLRMIRIDAPKK
jgi:cytochrome c